LAPLASVVYDDFETVDVTIDRLRGGFYGGVVADVALDDDQLPTGSLG
jgi:hypothetical protein